MLESVIERQPVPDSERAGELATLVPSLRAFALGLCRNRDAAEDLVYETILEAIVRIEERDPTVPLRAWLCTLMRNAFHTGVRLSTSPAVDPSGRSGAGPMGRRSPRRREAARAVCSLSAEQREAVVLVAVLGMEVRDAAAICGCGERAIVRRLGRAREALSGTRVGPGALELLRPA